MAIERARAQAVPKPWGVADVRPWSWGRADHEGGRVVGGSGLSLEAERETWLLVVSGSARAGKLAIATGDAVFAQLDRVDILSGSNGMVSLVAYAGAGGSVPQRLAEPSATDAGGPEEVQVPTPLTRTKTAPVNGRVGTMQ